MFVLRKAIISDSKVFSLIRKPLVACLSQSHWRRFSIFSAHSLYITPPYDLVDDIDYKITEVLFHVGSHVNQNELLAKISPVIDSDESEIFEVEAEVHGIITKVFVAPGDLVKKDQNLFELELCGPRDDY